MDNHEPASALTAKSNHASSPLKTDALGFADNLIVMHRGRVIASGEPIQVVNEQLLQDVFEVRAHIIEADHQKIVCLPRQPS